MAAAPRPCLGLSGGRLHLTGKHLAPRRTLCLMILDKIKQTLTSEGMREEEAEEMEQLLGAVTQPKTRRLPTIRSDLSGSSGCWLNSVTKKAPLQSAFSPFLHGALAGSGLDPFRGKHCCRSGADPQAQELGV